MNTNTTSTKISTPNFCALLFASSAIWACVEEPVHDSILRAGDATDPQVESGEPPPEDPPEEDPNEVIPPRDEEGCHAIYAQDLLPTFELTIDDDVWDDLEWDWEHGAEQEAKGLDPDPNHPLAEFRYGDIVITNAEIRLRGNADYWWDDPDKWQFQITFDNVDKDGHFLGLEVLAFDAATYNRHMLRDRLAFSIMRDMGIIAPCANSARLVVNGDFYGVFTSLEKLDKVFLERAFDDPSGDLWKRQNWALQTNKKTANDDRLDALNDAESIEELETYLDVEQALMVYAAEALIPDSDGGWAGGLNFFLYDDPLDGKFKLIPWDMDSTFEVFNDPENGEYPVNPDPVVWHKKVRYHGRPYYEIALEEEDWFWFYLETLQTQFEEAYDLDDVHEKIDTWTEQIKESVLADNNKPYDNEKYLKKVEELKDYVEERHDWLEEWFECWEDGGVPDKKGYCEEND